MQHRVPPLEDGKEPPPTRKPRAFPARILKFITLLFVLISVFTLLSIYIGVQNIVSMTRNSFLFGVDEPTGLSRWIDPPSALMHSMTDEELIWRASFVPQVNKYPFKRVPRIAFMFLTKGHLPLYPLWEKFLSGHEGRYTIYIHSLPFYEAKYPQNSPFYQRQIPSQVSEWGRMSMCDAERRLLANALLDVSNERFVLLSESCIPLFNFSFVYGYLTGSHHSFVNVFDDDGPYGRGRYNMNMYPDVSLSEWRKGSQWFEVNRNLAVIIITDTKYYPKFRDFCRPACYVDEHYFPTMLSIEVPHLVANRSLTWVDWSRGGRHPATFGAADVTESLFNRITSKACTYNGQNSSVCHLFARKFSRSSLQPLLDLAPKILDMH